VMLHRHKCPYVTLVMQGELRFYREDGTHKETRPTGSFVSGPANGEPHLEGGGDEDARAARSDHPRRRPDRGGRPRPPPAVSAGPPETRSGERTSGCRWPRPGSTRARPPVPAPRRGGTCGSRRDRRSGSRCRARSSGGRRTGHPHRA
jgi:hypothetical protein